jgi:hypothetical protein
MNPLHRNNWLGLLHQHSGVPIPLKESPEMLIDTPLLPPIIALQLSLSHDLGGVRIVVVNHLPCSIIIRSIHLQTLLIRRCGRSLYSWR